MNARERAAAQVYELAAGVLEEPRNGGATRLLEKIAMQEEQGPLTAHLVELGAITVLESVRAQEAVATAIGAQEAELARALPIR